MELLTAAFVTGTLLISFEGEGAGLALMAVAITIVGYQTGGPGGVAETVKGMGFFGALIFSPCVVVLSWRATRKWLPARVCRRPTAQQEAEGQREAERQRQAARLQDAERRQQAERERQQQQEAEMRREAARQRQAARQQDAERRRQAEWERQREALRQRGAEQRRTAQQKPQNWWDLLGVSPNASMAEIARTYRRTIQKYHPDRVLGLAPEIVELAESRSKALNAAYDQAKRTLLAST